MLRFLDEGVAAKPVLKVFGDEGVGKTELLRHAAGRQQARAYIGIDGSASTTGAHASSSVLRKLSLQIDVQAAVDGFRPRRFMMSELTNGLRSVAEKTLAPLVTGSFPALKSMIERASPSERDLDLIYVRHVLAGSSCVVHIDHGDDLIADDWKLIADLVEATDCAFFVEGRSNSLALSNIVEKSSSVMKVLPLEMNFADVLFSSFPIGLKDRLKSEFAASGDLKTYHELFLRRSIVDSEDLAGSDLTEGMIRLSRHSFLGLAAADRNALIAIAAHAGAPVGIGMLKRFIESSTVPLPLPSDPPELARRLEEAVLVVRMSNELQAVGLVLGIIASEPVQATVLLAFQKAWRDFYRAANWLRVLIPTEQRWLQMLRQCVALRDAVGVASCLEEIGILHQEAGGSADSVGFVKRLLSAFELRDEPIIAVALARYLYIAGWFEDARDVLTLAGETGSRRDKYLLAELYCASGHRERGMRLAAAYKKALILEGRDDTDAELCLELIILHGLRSNNDLERCRDRYRELARHHRFRKCAAYTVLLRFADVCLFRDEDFADCVASLISAIAFATERGQDQELVSIHLALAQQYGYRDLDAAGRSLADAMKAAKGRWLQYSTILNNLCVFGMYKGVRDGGAVSSLNDALLTCQDPLDEILTRNNIIIQTMLDRGTVDHAALTYVEALCNRSTVDKEIKKIVYFNISQCHKRLGAEDLHIRFREAWRSIDDTMDHHYWQWRRAEIGPDLIPAWRSGMDFYPVFLAHWKAGIIAFQSVSDDS